MEDLELIRILYENGAYSLKDVFDLVTIGEISEKDFFEITRLHYKGVRKSREWD